MRFAARVKGGNIYGQILHFAHCPLFFAHGKEMHFQKRNTLWIYDVITKCVYKLGVSHFNLRGMYDMQTFLEGIPHAQKQDPDKVPLHWLIQNGKD